MSTAKHHIFSDVHGETRALRALFNLLGFQKKSDTHYVSEENNLIVFIGDLVDRGRDHVGAIKIARDTADIVLLGNHELNNMWFATKVNGQYLRPHTKFNVNQHKSFVNQVTWGSADHDYALKFFQERPVFTELEGGVHLAHACWHQESIDYLKSSGALGKDNQLGRDGIQAFIEDEDFKNALEMVLYGPRQKLPEGFTIVDSHGVEREYARNLWMLSTSHLADKLDLNGGELTPWQRDFVNARALGRDFGSATGLTITGHYSLEGKPRVPKAGATCCCIDFGHYLTALAITAAATNDQKLDQNNMTSVPIEPSLIAA